MNIIEPNNTKYAPLTYQYISADPGAGKTQWAIHTKIPELMGLDFSVMMVVPSIQLANEISKNSNGRIRAIHSESVDAGKTVLAEIIKVVRDTYALKVPKAIVICEASYITAVELFSVFYYMMQEWVVIKDEPRDPLNIVSVKISNDVKRIISRFIGNIHETDMRLLSIINPHRESQILSEDDYEELSDEEVIRKWLNDETIVIKDEGGEFFLTLDDIDCGVFGPLALFKKAIGNRFNEVLIDTDAFEENILKYSIFQLPHGYSMFATAIFMKANFEDSFVFYQWQQRGVTWKPVKKVFEKMSSNRLQIHYLYDEKSQWSARFRNKSFDGVNNFDLYLEYIRNELPSGDFVYVANNAYTDKQLSLTGTRMPAECHGLNSFSRHTNVVLCGSYLINRGDEPFFAYYNSSTTDALAMRQTQYHIQQITRTDIRNYDSKSLVNVYVPTLSEALALLAYFEDATLADPSGERTGTLIKGFEPKVAEDPIPTNTHAVYGDSAWDIDVKFNDLTEFQPTPEDILSNGKPKALGHPHLQFVVSKQSNISSHGLDKTIEKKKYDHVKKSLPYVCAGVFSEGDRLYKDNCEGAKMIGFDLDDTTLTDAQLSKIMKQVEYVRYTTFSHKDNQFDNDGNPIRRIRIIAPYSRVATLSEHARIVRYYTEKLFTILYPQLKLTPDTLKDSCIDADKSNAWVKLFVPHNESDVLWVKRKNNRRTTTINVDEILAQVPPLPKIILPTVNDIVWKSTKPSEISMPIAATAYDKDERLFKKCMALIDDMYPGNRSSLAVKVGGVMKNIDIQFHHEIFQNMRMKGVGESALRSAKKYASGVSTTSNKKQKPIVKFPESRNPIIIKNNNPVYVEKIEPVISKPLSVEPLFNGYLTEERGWEEE